MYDRNSLNLHLANNKYPKSKKIIVETRKLQLHPDNQSLGRSSIFSYRITEVIACDIFVISGRDGLPLPL